MIPLSVGKIAVAVGGRMKYTRKFNKVTAAFVETDSRVYLNGALFIALKGPVYDGHDFIDEAFSKGAVCVISEHESDLEKYADKPVICVKSTYTALKDLARDYISGFNIPIVAVTGSVGKTTTRDLIASVLSIKYKTFKTEKNFNNEIGLPLSVLKLDRDHEAAVFEMGMSNFGEIHNLAEIVRPDISVITNIGDSHMENFKSRDEILKAKTEILDYHKPNGRIILNGDDELLKTLAGKYNNIKFYGLGEGNYFYADQIREDGLWGISCSVHYSGSKFFVKIPLPGRHMVQNTLAAVAVGEALNIEASAIKNGIENFRPPKQRMDIINTQSGITVINDTYNASPASMLAAIDVLATVKTRKICVLGDMLELGKKSPEYHYLIGKHAAASGVDIIICVGEIASSIYKGAVPHLKAGQRAVFFETQDEVLKELVSFLNDGDTVLVKASRAMKLENIVEYLKQR
ncbi:MAG: UDP-N-acetylmuramoyl-tripeptide--D-alanyl-D-alanine ligase [Clostridiales bacterium]|jgi:UDP-N-acetylmuramoyl-tripeptide--D-alanyl-D-alanine ligase|nr:UDP-N-acetylmuramoyl-tripeptide--D-alanyl-D-alanine ligase [Clostridiales bacterium]